MGHVSELRNVMATLYMGFTEILIGLVMVLTGLSDWYFDTFHFFGILGMGAILYSCYYCYFYSRDTGEKIWKMKKN